MKTEKIKLGQLEGIITSLGSLAQKELPIKTSYNITRINKAIAAEYDIFIEKRRTIAEKYALRDDKGDLVTDGNVIKLDSDKIVDAQKEFDELVAIEFEINFAPIKLEELGVLSIKPSELYNLERFIIE